MGTGIDQERNADHGCSKGQAFPHVQPVVIDAAEDGTQQRGDTADGGKAGTLGAGEAVFFDEEEAFSFVP